MATVGIIGGGAFGTALGCVVRRSGHEVVIWAREPEVISHINGDHLNPMFLPEVALDPGIRAQADLAAVTRAGEFLLMAVPAQHVRAVAGAMRPHVRPSVTVVGCSKGIERGSLMLMPEVLAAMLPEATIAVLSGPSFAREMASDLPCGVVLACADWSAAEAVARHIGTHRFCIHLSDDVVGTALGGVMKNVVSIASGIAHGRHLGENARATIITLGLEEAIRLAVAKGGKASTFVGLAGAGDFMLTANSLASRNTSLGVALGQGKKLADVLAGRKQVTEGALSVEAVAGLARQLHVDMPITSALDSLLNGGADLDTAMARFLAHLPPLYRAG